MKVPSNSYIVNTNCVKTEQAAELMEECESNNYPNYPQMSV